MEHREVHLLSRRLQIFGINVGHRVTWSSWEIMDMNCHCLSKCGRIFTSSDGIFTKCCEMNTRTILSVGPLTVSVCTLNDVTLVCLDSSSVHNDRNDAAMYIWVWWMYRYNVRTISPIRWYNRCQVYAILQYASEDTISDIFNGHQRRLRALALAFNTYKEKKLLIRTKKSFGFSF